MDGIGNWLEKAHWEGQLGVLLIGKAQAAYGAMMQEEAMNYNKVKREILYRLDINPETYWQAFKAKKKKEERDPRTLSQHLADLVTKCLKPAESSKTDIYDKILLEQFLADLDEETQSWVRYHRPVSSAEALRVAENFSCTIREKPPERNAKDLFKVVRQPGPLDYTAFKPGYKMEKQIYHVNLLKEWKEQEGLLIDPSSLDEKFGQDLGMDPDPNKGGMEVPVGAQLSIQQQDQLKDLAMEF
ncbi:hypothetical protein Y1Q_0019269 [Alligator mississippiensis]|uniref:SCAN box domain-containing protein n=1 Tax=Alligator mississippiensis TaxID=8496 RepID=A0A151MQS2_ALLMI|nr:hypothetical protein Y1Q_0019269 [Alligator mississippiensis]